MTKTTDYNSAIQTTELDLTSYDPVMDLIAVQMNKIEPSADNTQHTGMIQQQEMPLFHNMLSYSDFAPSLIILALFITGQLLINYFCSADKSKNR